MSKKEIATEEILVEIPEVVEEVIQVAPKLDVYVAVDGDSYASIAEKLDRGSFTKFEFAKWLHLLNHGTIITEGTEVKL